MLSMTVIRLSLLAAALLVASTAFAQVKTDGQWRGAGGAALSATSGNSNTTALSVNGEMLRATAQDKITLGANTLYGRSENAAGVSSTTANKWAAAGQYDYNLRPALFVFGKLGFEGDTLIDLSLRSTLAAGLGYKLIDTKETSFNVFGGVGYSTDQYDKTQTIAGKRGKSFSRASLALPWACSQAGQLDLAVCLAGSMAPSQLPRAASAGHCLTRGCFNAPWARSRFA